MILRTTETDLNGIINKLGIFKTSFADIVNAFKANGLKGAFNSIRTNSISDMDITNIEKYINLVDSGVNRQTAFYRTMMSSSIAAKDLAASYKKTADLQNVLDGITKTTTGSLIAQKIATILLKTAHIALNAVIGFGIGLLTSFVTSALSAGWEKLKYQFKSTEEKVKDLNKSLSETLDTVKKATDDFKNLKSSAESTIPRFVELAKGVDTFGKNVSLTDEEYKEFLELNNKISELFPELNLGMDSNGNAMLALSYNADTLTDSLNALVEAQRQVANKEIADTLPDTLKDIKDIQKEYDKEIDKVKKRKDDWTKVLKDIKTENLKTYAGSMYSTKTQAEEEAREVTRQAQEIGMPVKVQIEFHQTHDGAQGYTPKIAWDYENADMTKIEQLYNTKLEYEEKLIDNYENMIAAKWKSANRVVGSWLQTDFLFNELNESMQKIAQTMVAGLDFNALNLKTEDAIKDYITSNIIQPLFTSGDDVKDAFAEITDWRQQLKNSEITVDEFSENVQNAFSNLFSSMDSEAVDNFKNAFVSGFNQTEDAGADFNTVLLGLIETWSSFEKLPNPSENFTGFSNLISSDKFTTETENYINSVEKLKSALNNLRKDELDSKTKFELFEQFPALAAKTDNLDSAITNLIEDMSADIDSKIAELIKNAATEEDRIAFEAIRDVLAEIGNRCSQSWR